MLAGQPHERLELVAAPSAVGTRRPTSSSSMSVMADSSGVRRGLAAQLDERLSDLGLVEERTRVP